MIIKYEDIDRIITILENKKKELKKGESFTFEGGNLSKGLLPNWCIQGGSKFAEYNSKNSSNVSGSDANLYYYKPEKDKFWSFAGEIPEDYFEITVEEYIKYYKK